MYFANFGFNLTKSLEMPLYKALLASEVWARHLTYTSLVFVLHVKIVECEVHFFVTFLQDACTPQSLYFCIVSAQPLDGLTGVRLKVRYR